MAGNGQHDTGHRDRLFVGIGKGAEELADIPVGDRRELAVEVDGEVGVEMVGYPVPAREDPLPEVGGNGPAQVTVSPVHVDATAPRLQQHELVEVKVGKNVKLGKEVVGTESRVVEFRKGKVSNKFAVDAQVLQLGAQVELQCHRFGNGEGESGSARKAVAVFDEFPQVGSKGIHRQHKASGGVPRVPLKSALPFHLRPQPVASRQQAEHQHRYFQHSRHKRSGRATG